MALDKLSARLVVADVTIPTHPASMNDNSPDNSNPDGSSDRYGQ
jgi:hypothetical protein